MNPYLIILILALFSCSKNPMGEKGHIDPEHRPFLESAALNNIPVIDDSLFSGAEDQLLSGQLTVQDESYSNLDYEVLVTTQNGALAFDTETGDFQYTPNLDFFGMDFFSVRVSDGQNYSAAKTIFINILEQTDISGTLLVTEVTGNSVKVDFSNLNVDGGATVNLCLSEDLNNNDEADEEEYCSISNASISVSEAGDSTTWSEVEFSSSVLGFSLDACSDKKIFVQAEIDGVNNSQSVTSQLTKRVGWSPNCLANNGLKLWLDAQKLSSITSNFATTGINATGASGSTVVTTSADPRVLIPRYSRVRIAGSVYDVTENSVNSITISPALVAAVSVQMVSVLTVAEWQDQTDNNFDAIQATALRQPYLSYQGIGGLPSILSNGQARGLSVTGLSYNEFSIFMITREFDVTSNEVRSYIAKRASVGDNQFIFAYGPNARRITWDQTGSASRVDTGFLPQVNTNYLYNWTRKSGESRYQFVNGVNNYATNNNADFNNNHRLDIGHENHAAIRSINGFISEVIIFNQYLLPATREKVEGYLAWRWGMQANLPELHPYKTQMP